jgi:hypothetical protein
MQKVLHPGYFPVNACDAHPLYWRNFTLEQAMAAYWKVKSWTFSFSNYSSGGSGSVQVNVNADKMSDLVCSTFSQGSGTGSDEVFIVSGSVSPFGLSMEANCFDDINFTYFSTLSLGSQPVTIIIGDETISTTGELPFGFSATVVITATSFF